MEKRLAGFELLDIVNRRQRVEKNPYELLSDQNQRDISLLYGVAIDQVMKGKGTADDVGHLAQMVSTALVLCERGHGAEFLDEVILAQHALWRLKMRVDGGAGLAFDAPGLQAMRRAYELHNAQIGVAGQGELHAAWKEVIKRYEEGNHFSGSEVVPVRA
ncbi:hypothetical protein [Burkholderia gladioli]|uniref:hypothetical protein n=1 Tax=Burkholderia gladioli TaxID=28095 RepID=UPI0016413409|nr:hypothetical protein [Burkholderia gladioli]